MIPIRDEQIDGAIYIARKHRFDLETIGLWVGLVIVLSAASWGVTHAIDLLPHSHPIGLCSTVAQCQRQILAHPIRGPLPKGFPLYHPVTP